MILIIRKKATLRSKLLLDISFPYFLSSAWEPKQELLLTVISPFLIPQFLSDGL